MRTTALYAGLSTFIYLALAFRVIGARQRLRVAYGTGEHDLIERRVRAHGNFAEYVPLALVLMGVLESMSWSVFYLHACGLALLAGRLAHAYSCEGEAPKLPWRAAGMILTFSCLIALAIACLVAALR